MEISILFVGAAALVARPLANTSATNGQCAPTRTGGLDDSKPVHRKCGHLLGEPSRTGFWVALFLSNLRRRRVISDRRRVVDRFSHRHAVHKRALAAELVANIRAVMLGLLSLGFTLPAIVLGLRLLERRDSAHDAPPVDSVKYAK